MATTLPVRYLNRLSRTGLTAEDLRDLPTDPAGIDAVDMMGEEIGTIEDALIDPVTLQAPFLVLVGGGILGIGRHERLIPRAAVIRFNSALVVVDRIRDLILSTPDFRDDMDRDEFENHYLAVSDLYGVGSDWQGETGGIGATPRPATFEADDRSDDASDEGHRVHRDHPHVHTPGCGHETRPHDGHDDFEHDGHWHAKHGAHYDEHEP